MTLKKIWVAVVSVHCALFLWAAFIPASFKEKKKDHRLIVKMVTPQTKVVQRTSPPSVQEVRPAAKKTNPLPSKTPPPAAQQPAPNKKTAPKKNQQPQQAQKKPTHSTPKQPAQKKSPADLKQQPRPQQAVPQHLLRELEETIAKIDENRDKIYTSKKLSPAQKVKPLELAIDGVNDVEVNLGEASANYRETLVAFLHQTLNLPDYGEVKIQVTLRRDGSVEKLKVLKTESEKNRKYLETHLPLLKFPINISPDKKELNFVLTFCNEL